MTALHRPLPSPTTATKPFWQAAKEGRLVMQSCAKCKHLQFYPREICTACMHDHFDWPLATGQGHIYTYTINYRAANSYIKDRVPYVVAVVELDEGVRMMANIVDTEIQNVHIGARVQVVFEPVNDTISLVQFKVMTKAET